MSKDNNTKFRILDNSVLGKPLDKSKPVIIVGAGIAGLFMGYYLKKANFDFKILEKRSISGGMLQTYNTNFGLIENSAFSFRWGEEIIALCKDLNLDVIEADSVSNKKYFLRNGEFRKFPLNFFEASISLYKILFSKVENPKTLQDFGEKNLGSAALKYLLEPAFQGIYATTSENLSFPAIMPSIAETFNSKERMIWQVIKVAFAEKKQPITNKPLGFRKGMQELVSVLSNYLKDHIQLNTTLPIDQAETSNAQIILTTPAQIAASYFTPKLKKQLQSVKYNQLVTATIFIRKSSLQNFKKGFGCLVPQDEQLNTLGIIYNDLIFPERIHSDIVSSFTIIMSNKNDLILKQTNEIEEILYKEMKQIYGFDGVFLESKIIKWTKALPIYSPQLNDNWFSIHDTLTETNSKFRLFGNYTGQISIRGMCTSAKEFVDKAI